MPKPPFTRFPKDPPLPVAQRNELTKAFKNAGKGSAGAGGVLEQTVIVQTGGQPGNGTTSPVILAGDVVGAAGSNRIAKIQGTPLATQAIEAGQTYVLTNGMLAPSSLAGDVSGSLIRNSVQAIQGTAIAANKPTDQQSLVYSAAVGEYISAVHPGAMLMLWGSCR